MRYLWSFEVYSAAATPLSAPSSSFKDIVYIRPVGGSNVTVL